MFTPSGGFSPLSVPDKSVNIEDRWTNIKDRWTNGGSKNRHKETNWFGG